MVQEVNQELLRAQDVLSLWSAYNQLSDHCSLRLQQLRTQWEVLASSQTTATPHDTQSELDAVEVSSAHSHCDSFSTCYVIHTKSSGGEPEELKPLRAANRFVQEHKQSSQVHPSHFNHPVKLK